MEGNNNRRGVRSKVTSLGVALAAVLTGALAVAPAAEARITQLQIVRTESPTFGGMIFGTNANLVSATLPTARNPDGSSIVSNMIVDQIFDAPTGTDFTLPFAANTLDQSKAYMVVHNHTQFVGGPLVNRVTVPTSVRSYINNTTVRINRADPFLAPYDQGAAFEFVFPAKDPIVEGLGFAATRDAISFLKHDTSTQNPVRNAIQWALGRGDSESGRYLKGLLYWGFNADENGQIVFDGLSPHISGSHFIASNDRFGDANATGRSYQRHLSAKMVFPFK